ncbi:MAG: tetrathionate reductase family octaheme c-type cytochrome [Gammaproteobacteria bacterium]|nr:tetrathionate reductase family octaheme c-type cytochrome [Gammaproteobacteria bacterium]
MKTQLSHAVLLTVLATGSAPAFPQDAWQFLPDRAPLTDHSTFFDKPFPDGPSVTRACLECHPQSASDIMKTAHWNLVGDEVAVPGHDQPTRIGKRNLINNFCIGIRSNWPGCTSCHIGFGWEDDSFDLSDETLVDCLVCHEQTGTYHKDAGDAGWPAADVDLLAAARSVGLPTRSNCGACHFMAGGGNAVKHGDLDESLLFPNPEIDVHMGRLGFHCIDCHQAEDHLPPGRLLTVSVDDSNRLHCTACHKGADLHGNRRIDSHLERIACQTCHIPFMAVKEGTKLSWDWSEAGRDLPITDEHLYLKIKGRFTWVKGARPEYAWYNGTGKRYLLGDKIDPASVTQIAAPLGSKDDPAAKIHPFKIHRGRQVYDVEHRHFILPHVYGDKGFWTRFDWDEALRIGSEVTGLAFSGRYDFAATEMYIPQNHMVVDKQRALRCPDCHGESSAFDWEALGYAADPLLRPAIDHEPIPLLDRDGELVHESGEPLSTAMTCSQCHEIEDEAFMTTHAYHERVVEASLPGARRALLVEGPRIRASDSAEQMNCFLCHLDDPDVGAWRDAKRSGDRAWAVAATLTRTGLISRTAAQYRWEPGRLDEDELAVIRMAFPRPRHCGACHGAVAIDRQPLTLDLGSEANWSTETTGQLFSAQPMRLSALNLRDKDSLGQAWDIHAQRLIECRECHYAKSRPDRMVSGEVGLPEHQPGQRRECTSCHRAETGHEWLPEMQRHLQRVTCEACHVPTIRLPARRHVDATVVDTDGSPLIAYRGGSFDRTPDLRTAYIDGYSPLLLEQFTAAGEPRWTPFNVQARWYWIDAANGREVAEAQVRGAWMSPDGYHEAVLELFDSNHDGGLGRRELRLDTPEKLTLIVAQLRARGVADPVVEAELRGFELHHSVNLHDATRHCDSCHETAGQAAFPLADYVPGDVRPSRFLGLPAGVEQQMHVTPDGQLQIHRPLRLSEHDPSTR